MREALVIADVRAPDIQAYRRPAFTMPTDPLVMFDFAEIERRVACLPTSRADIAFAQARQTGQRSMATMVLDYAESCRHTEAFLANFFAPPKPALRMPWAAAALANQGAL